MSWLWSVAATARLSFQATAAVGDKVAHCCARSVELTPKKLKALWTFGSVEFSNNGSSAAGFVRIRLISSSRYCSRKPAAGSVRSSNTSRRGRHVDDFRPSDPHGSACRGLQRLSQAVSMKNDSFVACRRESKLEGDLRSE